MPENTSEKIIAALECLEQGQADQSMRIEQVQSDLSMRIEQVQSDLSMRVEQVQADLSGVKIELSEVKTDLSGFKEEANERFDSLQADIRKVSQSVAVIEVEHGNKLRAIYEGIKTILIDYERLEVHEDKLDDHDNRLFAIEQHLKA